MDGESAAAGDADGKRLFARKVGGAAGERVFPERDNGCAANLVRQKHDRVARFAPQNAHSVRLLPAGQQHFVFSVHAPHENRSFSRYFLLKL